MAKLPVLQSIEDLSGEIGVLSEDRGYLNISETESNPDNLIYNGKYSIFNPAGLPYPQCRYNFDITARGTYLIQLATIVYQAPAAGSANLLGLTFKRVKDADGFKEWNKNPTSDEITALQAKTYQELPILRSGTVLNHILSSNVRFGLFNTVYDASTTDAPDTYWGTCRFTKQASNVWTVEWLSSVGNKRYQRTIYVDHWQEDKWSILATTDKIDISLLNGNKNELTPTFTPMASKSGNVATVNMTFEFYNPNVCIVPFLPSVTTYFRAESLLSEQTYRGVIYKDGRVNIENPPADGTRIIINLPYTCV